MTGKKERKMKKYRVRIISIILCLSVITFSNAGFSGELSKTKADPGNNATWTGEAGKDNFIGSCAPCHGETGKGDGPLADTLGEGVKPRNLSDAKLLSTRTDEFLFRVIKSGGAAAGFADAMPSWNETFTDAEIKQIIQHIRNNICKCKYQDK
ncbi:MAG: cytochrome c [Betaproteobacteria bacterium]|nr:cytochrome c [Betaproteobacteria bacterium]